MTVSSLKIGADKEVLLLLYQRLAFPIEQDNDLGQCHPVAGWELYPLKINTSHGAHQ
jgi:hypothetical protein